MSDISDGHVLIDGTVYRVVFEVRGQPLPDGGRFPLPVDLYRLVPVAGGTGSFTPVSPSVDPEEG